MNDLLETLIHNNWTALLEMILFPTLFIICLRRISHSCKQLVANRYGIRGQIFFGWFGIVIHELSHLIIALIFGHKITSFSLLHVPRDANDSQLGFVNHTFNPKSKYQRTGNLFIGIAPIIGCAVGLWLFTALLAPSLITQFNALPRLTFNFSMFNLGNLWQLILLIVIASNVSIGGFDLSYADLHHIKFGLITIIVIVIIATSFATFLGVAPQYLNWLHHFSTTINGLLFFSLIIVLLNNGLIRLITNY